MNTDDLFAIGFCKAAEEHGVDPALLLKQASYGDIVNAGYSSMAMGSPLAPRLYTPGTNEIKPTKEIQQEQARTAVGGAVGLAAGVAPEAALSYFGTLPIINVNPTIPAAVLLSQSSRVRKGLKNFADKLGLTRSSMQGS